MANDPIWIVETDDGDAIGYALPVSGLTVVYGGTTTTISSVNATSLTLANGKTVHNGQHPGAWPKCKRSNLNSVRGPDWPTATGDVEVQGKDAVTFGAQSTFKAVIVNADGSITKIT